MSVPESVDVGATAEQRLILSMLAAPGAGPIWGDPMELAKAVDWARFCGIADEMVKPYLSWICGQAGFDVLVPDDVKSRLAGARLATGMRNLRWAAELRQILTTFRASNASLLVVKGTVLQRTVYPEPSTRPMSDMDLVVRREQMTLVRELLTSLGFLSRTSVEAHLPGVGLAPDEEAYFLKSTGTSTVMVEVHTKLENHSGYCSPDWDACIELMGADGIEVPSLDPHAALRHLCFHLAKHGFEHGLMWLLDIRLFVERYRESIQWEDFVDECEPESLPLLAFTLTLVGDWLGAEIPERIREMVPPDNRHDAVPLAWSQVWHQQDAREPLHFVTLLASGNPRRILSYLRLRARRWTAPIPGYAANRYLLLMRRLGADIKSLRARIRDGGFRLSSIRSAQDSDRRIQRLRRLLWPPE